MGFSATSSAQADLSSAMRVALNDPVTFAEFDAAIRHSSTSTSPGFSGLSFNMIKRWPEDLKRQVFDALSVLWAERTTPAGWKIRMMCLKPKTDDMYPAKEDLRPLALLESLRKLWERILLNRMQRVWETHHPFTENQHFGPNRSTSDALLTLRNVIEEAHVMEQPLYVSSWDIKKAFDSVSKPLLIMAWVRMGVPADIATWIVALDNDGKTVVRTPHGH